MISAIHEAIHITLSFDENYTNQFYAVAASIFANNSYKIVLHAITSGIDEVEKNIITDYVNNYNASINFYSVPENFGKNFRLDGNWTAATYYRLLFPQILPEHINKFIYIDSDTLVIGDIAKLWSIDLNSHVVAAVEDSMITTRPDLGIYKPNSYFNAGVLLINRSLWQEQVITTKAITFLNDFPEKVLYADQDALNYLFKDNWIKIPNRFNLMFADIPETLPNNQFQEFLADKVILHFTQHRPWKMLCENRFRYLYHHYLGLTPAAAAAGRVVEPWTLENVKNLLRIRLRELYFDNPTLSQGWRTLKQSFVHKAL